MPDFHNILFNLKSLTLYRNILQDTVVQAFQKHLEALAGQGETAHPAQTYAGVYHLLAGTCNPLDECDAWQNHLLDLIIHDDNPFSRAAYTSGADYTVFLPAVKRDLLVLQQAFQLSTVIMRDATEQLNYRSSALPGNAGQLPLWTAPPPLPERPAAFARRLLQVKEKMAAEPQWDRLAGLLGDHYAACGCGIYSRYIAFKWQNGSLHGISRPDPVSLDKLIGYQDIREEIINNTRQFLYGYPANNILLYGDRGTGKSSTVKALLNEYWPRGLRLVEVPKRQLAQFPAIIEELHRRKHRFILFVDDLSFEENETAYKDLKALLEGGVEVRPANVIIYATSNRRHLVRETFADRERNTAGREIHAMDSVQEKLSLADRFGMTVIFPTPDQELFLQIAAGLARQRGIAMEQDELRQRALQWSMWHNGRSPRAARQFIDHLEGQLALERKTGG
jgi:hypothetical protein